MQRLAATTVRAATATATTISMMKTATPKITTVDLSKHVADSMFNEHETNIQWPTAIPATVP